MDTEKVPSSGVGTSQFQENEANKLNEDGEFEPGDTSNPINWPVWRKWSIVIPLALMRMIDNFATVMIVPAAPQVLEEFGTRNNFYTVLLVSIWEFGEGIGPFFVAPLSEFFGRLPVYHAGNVLFVLFSVASALSTNISMLVGFRFLNGLVAASSLTLGPSIVADLFVKEQRGTAMALEIALPMLGPFAAPIAGSFLAQARGWRWTIWANAIAVGSLALISLTILKETYKFKILRSKGKNRQTVSDIKKKRAKFWRSATMPARMLFSPVVFVVSLITAITYGISFLILTTLAEIIQNTYHFNDGIVGVAFLGRAIGNIVGIAVYALAADRYLKHKRAKDGASQPEHRLPFMLFGACFLPPGLLLYGWTADFKLHWSAPIIGTGVIGFSLLLTVLPTENYLCDIYDEHAASAVAAGIVLRATFGAFFPLIGPALYGRVGLGWGNTILAFLTLCFIPAIITLMAKGESIRKRARSG